MPTVFSEPTTNGGFRNCDARCHNAIGNRCTCICGGTLHGFASLTKRQQRQRVAEHPDRFNALSQHQIAIINKLAGIPEVHLPTHHTHQLPLEVKP